MSSNGETADLMVRESIQITESAVKLAGLGAKNLAALLLALANDQQKVAGKTSLKKLLQANEELVIFSVKAEDLQRFKRESKRYGILYCPLINKTENTGMVEIMARSRDAKQINRMIERLGYPIPHELQNENPVGKEALRALSENSSDGRGNGATTSIREMKNIETEKRPSVKGRLAALKAAHQTIQSPEERTLFEKTDSEPVR